MTRKRVVLIIASLLVLLACGGPLDVTPASTDTPSPDSTVTSEPANRDMLGVIDVYNAEVTVISWLRPCIRAWGLSLSNKELTTRYLGQGEWLIHVSFREWGDEPPDGDFGTWKVPRRAEEVGVPIEEVAPYDDVAKAVSSKRWPCLREAGEALMIGHTTTSVEERDDTSGSP